MSAKGNCTKEADGTIVYKTVSKQGSAPAELDSSKWYMDKCEIVGYCGEHLTIKVNRDGIIRVDGNYKDGKASRSFFNEYIIPDGIDHEALEFRIYEADANTLVIVGAFGSHGGEVVSSVPAKQVVAQPQQQSVNTIKRTENVRISSTFTETFESTELEGSEDMSKEIRVTDNKFEAKVNVSEYKSEEVHVKISKTTVLIYTSRKEVTKTSTRREIKKTFEIPAGVKPESITSVVGEDGNLTVSAAVDKELARQQQLQEEAIKKTREIVQQTSTNETLIRIRRVNTVKNVTGQDLKDVKIVKDRFEMNVDLREYELEEATVKIIKSRRVITISANHKSQFESRSTFREFSLPSGAPDSNPNAIDAVLNSNGILTITGPCSPQTSSPAALTDVTDDVTNKAIQQQQQRNTTVQEQNTSVQNVQKQNTTVQQQQQQQQQQTTAVQQQQKNTSVQQQLQDTSVQQIQSEQQIVQQSRYTKITRETFTSSTMTSLDITDATDDEPIVTAPDTPIDDVTQDMVQDQDGNYVVEVNIKDYRAEEITIKASKATITIIGQKADNPDRQFVKTIRVPLDVVVTPDTIRSILDKSTKTITIIITKKKTVTTTTTKQITDDNTTDRQTIEQKRNDSLQQQRQQQVQQRQESTEETQTEVHTQKINQQKQQVQKKQESIEETQTEVHTQKINQQRRVQKKQESVEETEEIQTQQQINNQQKQIQQRQENVRDTQTKIQTNQQLNQQRQESIEETQTEVHTQKINQQKQVQKKQESVEEIQTQQQINNQQNQQIQQRQTNQQLNQQKQLQDQRQQQNSTVNTTTTNTSKRTIKTTTTTVESLEKLGYNFASAKTEKYTGDPKFFERATTVVDYKPEDLEVKIAMPWVIVEGKQEMTAENGWRSKSFTKMFTVPEGVRQENIQLEWNDAGDVVNCTARIG